VNRAERRNIVRGRLAGATQDMLIVLVAAAAASSTPTLEAQQPGGDCSQVASLSLHDFTDSRSVLARALSITERSPARGSGIFASAVRRVPVCLDSAAFAGEWTDREPIQLELAAVEALIRGNSTFPRDRNNGVMWAGVGMNTQVQAGVQASWRWFSAAAIPKFVHQPNLDFTTTIASLPFNRSPFANPYHLFIDNPKRFGDEPFSVTDPGQSYVGLSAGPVEARFSTENLWLGSAQSSAIVLSNTAGGFPHFRVGTSRPLDIYIGHLEVNAFWGSVSESDFFDGPGANDSHLFAGSVLVFEPRPIKGLYLGATQVYHDSSSALGHDLGFYLGVLGGSPTFVGGGNREGNGIGALFGRWVLPESGFEVYVEWARDDTPYNLMDLIREPDWTQAYMAGLQKVFLSRERLVRVYGEVVHLGESTPVRAGKGHATFYTHGTIWQGHTHRGQMLGAGIGLGSDSRSLGVDVFTGSARTGVWIEHARYDEDTYYRTFARRFGEARHNAELTAEVRRLQRYRDFTIEGVMRASRQYDRDFITLANDAPPGAETNWGTELIVSWRP
jgi:hypothetical protein